MTELISDVDPGMLPPRTRRIFSEVGRAIEQGWKPIELAQMLGVAPSFLSELLAELRTALGLVNGVFPTASEDDYRALLESIATVGVQVPVVVDERGVIDGHARIRACKELAHASLLLEQQPDWQQIAAAADTDRAEAVEMYGKQTVTDCQYLAGLSDDTRDALPEHRFDSPPIDKRTSLSDQERRQLAITINAHRRHLGRGERRLLVEVELMLDRDRSDGQIARIVGCSRQFVWQVRQQLVADEEAFGNPRSQVEPQSGLAPWRPVVELDCPHCQHHLLLERGGRDYRLELTAG